MAQSLYLRQYRSVPWKDRKPDEQQADLLEVERWANEGGRTLVGKEPTHVIMLSAAFCYMWGLVP